MALQLKQVTKQVGGETHIHPTNLELQSGDFNVLLGTTLSGKTTLLHLMSGLEKPTSGEVWFNGTNVTRTAVQKRNVSMVYQQFINYPNFTVFENIASPLRVNREKNENIKSKVHSIAELLKLTPFLERYPNELSGGQQQRTALARALVKEADLVLLDEPLANLDFKLREELREELPKLFANRDCVVVYATTEPMEALLLGGFTATLFEGRVTQFGSTAESYRKPADLVSAKVFSEPPINVSIVRKTGSKFSLADSIEWEVPDYLGNLSDGEYTLGIRPHHVTPNDTGSHSVPVSGQVIVTELSGSESVIHFQLGDQVWVSQSHGVLSTEVGENAPLFADMSKIFLFNGNGELIKESITQ